MTKSEKKLIEALKYIKQMLTIPAAEYVPAIPDVWEFIDEILNETNRRYK